ncbi:hypothetical protein F511_13482 [Dorcoceras hygrometricum]|uniref:Uncharacterized protein n=1 Tax=Dorcoceras hygrometricum TaxID=472368 RepID=A0A2Z7AAA5_9LAMI|nr:hypothetical protein F511_13482 [Dorcoceras hygrometricum]
MQIYSDLVIYRTTLARTFQVVTICRVDKSEVLVVLISPHDSNVIETLHDRRLTLTRLPTHLESLGGGIGDTASRGPTTIVAPESQFRTCPSDHGKASRNIAP